MHYPLLKNYIVLTTHNVLEMLKEPIASLSLN